MANRIEIVQWREYGDDEDSLTVEVIADDDKSTPLDRIAEDYELVFNGPTEGPRTGYSINDALVEDGQVLISHDGRKFRVTIEEVAADETPAPVCRAIEAGLGGKCGDPNCECAR